MTKDQQEAMWQLLTEIYNNAYNIGHQDTVDGGYTHVLPVDLTTYHRDIVEELVADSDYQAALPQWIPVSERLPELRDDSVLVYFSETGSIETVHIEDYFADITAGFDPNTGEQLYTKWFISQKVTHWMPLPPAPDMEIDDD